MLILVLKVGFSVENIPLAAISNLVETPEGSIVILQGGRKVSIPFTAEEFYDRAAESATRAISNLALLRHRQGLDNSWDII